MDAELSAVLFKKACFAHIMDTLCANGYPPLKPHELKKNQKKNQRATTWTKRKREKPENLAKLPVRYAVHDAPPKQYHLAVVHRSGYFGVSHENWKQDKKRDCHLTKMGIAEINQAVEDSVSCMGHIICQFKPIAFKLRGQPSSIFLIYWLGQILHFW